MADDGAGGGGGSLHSWYSTLSAVLPLVLYFGGIVLWWGLRGRLWYRSTRHRWPCLWGTTPKLPPHDSRCCCFAAAQGSRKHRALRVAPCFPHNPCAVCVHACGCGFTDRELDLERHPCGPGMGCKFACCGCKYTNPELCEQFWCRDTTPEDVLPSSVATAATAAAGGLSAVLAALAAGLAAMGQRATATQQRQRNLQQLRQQLQQLQQQQQQQQQPRDTSLSLRGGEWRQAPQPAAMSREGQYYPSMPPPPPPSMPSTEWERQKQAYEYHHHHHQPPHTPPPPPPQQISQGHYPAVPVVGPPPVMGIPVGPIAQQPPQQPPQPLAPVPAAAPATPTAPPLPPSPHAPPDPPSFAAHERQQPYLSPPSDVAAAAAAGTSSSSSSSTTDQAKAAAKSAAAAAAAEAKVAAVAAAKAAKRTGAAMASMLGKGMQAVGKRMEEAAATKPDTGSSSTSAPSEYNRK